jgi:hypothetical protein
VKMSLIEKLHAKLSRKNNLPSNTSGTLYDEEEKEFRYLPFYGTSMVDIGHFGVGLRLYFMYILCLGILFTCFGLIALPLALTALKGNMMQVEGKDLFARSTIANLGYCGDFGIKLKVYNPPLPIWAIVETSVLN